MSVKKTNAVGYGENQMCFGKKCYSTSLNGMALYRLLQKISLFEDSCEDRTQKINVCPLKKPKTECFIANSSSKKLSAAEVFENDRSWTRRTDNINIESFWLIGAEKTRFK